jgi:methionine-rich copper-binding protein CopC
MRHGRATLPVRVVLVVAAAVAGMVLSAGPAAAHNVLTGTSPTDGQSVARTPATVVLTFNEPAVAMGTEVVITGPSGLVQQGAPRLVDNTVSQDLAPGAPAGRYLISWRVTSRDGHPVSGRFSFTAVAAGGGTPAASSGPSGSSNGPGNGQPVRRAVPTGWAWLVLVVLIVSVLGITQRGIRLGRTRPPRDRDQR